MIFKTGSLVVGSNRRRVIFFALQVAVNLVVLDGQPAAVFNGLEVATDDVGIGNKWPAVVVKLNVAIHAHACNRGGCSLLDLDAAADGSIIVDDDVGCAFRLDIADDLDGAGLEGSAAADRNRAFGLGAI